LTQGFGGGLPEGPDLPPAEQLESLLQRGRLLGLALTMWADFGVWILGRSDAAYPARLRGLRGGAPPILFGAGPLSLLDRGGLAIVGSRDVDEEAVGFTRRVAGRCSEQRVQVVSGGARGVDREALGAALEAGGTMVAVPSDGLLKAITERTARTAIREEVLALASPYDPDAGFTVGRAMARNKYIYALADFALVVRFATDEGGTWAGAVEQLNRHQGGTESVPVFLRIKNNPEDGLSKLQAKGALPFPEEAFFTDNVVESLQRAASRTNSQDTASAAAALTSPAPTEAESAVSASATVDRRAQVEPEPVVAAAAASETDSCYARCLALLLQELRHEPSKKELPEVAKRLDLVPQQFKQWLDRAIAEGKVKTLRKGRRVVYTTANDTPLFDRGGDAA
jgi:predicted Rossmann fold nucleotide-binding protein DprA/Smf involved in DNA uptake